MKIFIVGIVIVAILLGTYTVINDDRSSLVDSKIELAPKNEKRNTPHGVSEKAPSARTQSQTAQFKPDQNIGSVEYDAVGDPIDDGLPEVSPELEERYAQLDTNSGYPTLASRLAEVNARRPNANFSAEDILRAVSQEQAWTSRSGPGPNLKNLTPEEIDDGRNFIDFNTLKVESLMPGDTMSIAVDSIGRTFEVQIDKVKIFEDGNITWKGGVLNEGIGDVSITQSDKVTVASIVLENEDYTIESHGSDGWIVDSATLFKIDDPNTPDYIIPEEEAHRHE